MPGQKYEIFTAAKRTLRIHPDWTDEQVAEHIGAKPLEYEIVREARKDHEADQATSGTPLPGYPG